MGGMGFRDIQAFNLALLAKQAWRLIHNTHSLFYRVYKARYFPNCSFMDTGLGNNPSYFWRSLLAAREIIQEGVVWKVGDGRKIVVSKHILREDWAIWNARNKFCFEKIQPHPEYILREATGFPQEYQRLNATQVPGGWSFSNKTKVRVEWCCYVLD